MKYFNHHNRRHFALVLLTFYLTSTFANAENNTNTNIVNVAKSHHKNSLKARNFNKVFEQYMKEAQVYMPSSNETFIENHFYDDTNKDTLKNCQDDAVAFEFVYE